MLIIFIRQYRNKEFYKELRLEHEPELAEEFILKDLEIEGKADSIYVEIGAGIGYEGEPLVYFVKLVPQDKRKRPGGSWRLFERKDIHFGLWRD